MRVTVRLSRALQRLARQHRRRVTVEPEVWSELAIATGVRMLQTAMADRDGEALLLLADAALDFDLLHESAYDFAAAAARMLVHSYAQNNRADRALLSVRLVFGDLPDDEASRAVESALLTNGLLWSSDVDIAIAVQLRNRRRQFEKLRAAATDVSERSDEYESAGSDASEMRPSFADALKHRLAVPDPRKAASADPALPVDGFPPLGEVLHEIFNVLGPPPESSVGPREPSKPNHPAVV